MAEDGSILFSDIGDRIMKYDPLTGKATVFREPSGRANGLIFDLSGRLIAAEGANTGGQLMCLTTLSVGWDGRLHDCDFNQMLNLGLAPRRPRTIHDFDLEALSRRQFSWSWPRLFPSTRNSGRIVVC